MTAAETLEGRGLVVNVLTWPFNFYQQQKPTMFFKFDNITGRVAPSATAKAYNPAVSYFTIGAFITEGKTYRAIIQVVSSVKESRTIVELI